VKVLTQQLLLDTPIASGGKADGSTLELYPEDFGLPRKIRHVRG
jgi:hypothetical protein